VGALDVLLAIVLVGVLIFLHEAGHFVVAKAMGVRVKAFSIGFGPALASVRRGETRYQLSLVPFGGYVMFDEPDPAVTAPDPRSFEAQSAGRRALIAVAGVATNLVVAFAVLLALYGLYGLPRLQLQVAAVVAHSPAAAAGLRRGDVLVQVGGVSMAQDPSAITSIVAAHDERPLVVVYRRGNALGRAVVVPRPSAGAGHPVRIGVYLQEAFGYGGGSAGARLGAAWSGTGQVLTLLVGGLGQLVSGRVPASQLGGPVRIVSETSQVAATGVPALLYWLAILSANLAVLNAVPFPGLDGGRLAFLLGEVLARGRRNIRLEQAINFIGLVVLMLFIGALTVQDIARLRP
jgi:regulator of sigma E protease